MTSSGDMILVISYCLNTESVCFRMAGQGRTIIMSIHQPRYSIYRLFDSLTLLANGKQVYHGPAQDALDYFANIGNIIHLCEIEKVLNMQLGLKELNCEVSLYSKM